MAAASLFQKNHRMESIIAQLNQKGKAYQAGTKNMFVNLLKPYYTKTRGHPQRTIPSHS